MAFNYTTTWLDNNISVTSFHTSSQTASPTRRRRTPEPTSSPTPDPKKCYNKCRNTLIAGDPFQNTTVDPQDPTLNIDTTCQNICGYYTTSTPTTSPSPLNNIFNFTSSTNTTSTPTIPITTILPLSTIQTPAPTPDPRKCWTKCRNTLLNGETFQNTTVDPQDPTTNIDNTCSNLCGFYITAIPTSPSLSPITAFPTSSNIPTSSPTPDPKKCFSKCQNTLTNGNTFKNTTIDDPDDTSINIPYICSDLCEYETTAEPTTSIPTKTPTPDPRRCFLNCKSRNTGMYDNDAELTNVCGQICSFTPQIETTHYNDTLNMNLSTPSPTVDAQKCYRKCKNTFSVALNGTNATEIISSFDLEETCQSNCGWYITTTWYNSTGRGKGPGSGRNNTRRAGGGRQIVRYMYDAENMPLKQTLVVLSLIFLCLVVIATGLALTIKKNRDRMQIQWRNKTGKFFLLSLSIALTLYFTNAIVMTYWMFDQENVTEQQRPWLMIFGRAPFQIGRFIMEIFFISRIHFIFGQSANRVHPAIIGTLCAFSVIALIGSIVGTLGHRSVLDWFGAKRNGLEGPRPSTIVTATSVAIGSLVTMVVMYLYIKILYKVTIRTGEIREVEVSSRKHSIGTSVIGSSTHRSRKGTHSQMRSGSVSSMNSRANSPDAQSPDTMTTLDEDEEDDDDVLSQAYVKIKVAGLQQHQLQMLENITKNTLLGIIGLLSTMLLTIQIILEYAGVIFGGSTMIRCLASFDGGINIWCMYLIFGWTGKQYMTICKYPHLLMKRACIWCAKKSIVRKAIVKHQKGKKKLELAVRVSNKSTATNRKSIGD